MPPLALEGNASKESISNAVLVINEIDGRRSGQPHLKSVGNNLVAVQAGGFAISSNSDDLADG